MPRNIIKYVGLALVMVGIVVVMKNLFANDTEWKQPTTTTAKKGTYSATVSLTDSETKAYISNSKLVVKDANGKVVDEWTTANGVHLISNLKNGTYTLNQETANSKYYLNKDTITFKINGKDERVSMYNIALTEEEIKNGVSNTSNNSTVNPSEEAVENTSSFTSLTPYILAILSITLGGVILYKTKKEY